MIMSPMGPRTKSSYAGEGQQQSSTEVEDIIGIRYIAMTGEDITSWEDLACAIVISKERKLVRAF
jgi:hypothetical protein